MKHVTVGVAGHIDHGKTALVKALTGAETDRLPEERERGMSIVLGFAHLSLPGGEIDLIDVPGHERFVKTMIAGATGINSVLLVVAATEGAMPQTIEHLALCSLLGVENGLVVVTKADLAPPDRREPIAQELRAFLAGTFLAQAPMVFTSAITSEGIADLRASLSELLAQASPASQKEGFYLPVDRVFTMTGHGTVATGTLRRGTIRVGDTVEILPRGDRAVVRGLEVHGEPVDQIGAGWRTAVNLRGVSKDSLEHGDLLATPCLLTPTLLIDAELSLLPPRLRPAQSAHRLLRHGETVRVCYATRDVSARVHLLDRDEVRAGETALVQLRFGVPQAAPVGERFILRTVSPAETIGGGRFIDIAPKRHTRHDSAVLGRLKTLAHGAPEAKLAEKLAEAGFAGREIARLLADLDIDPSVWTSALPELPVVLCVDPFAIHRSHFEQACDLVMAQLSRHHAAHRTERGIKRDLLHSLLPKGLPLPVFQQILSFLCAKGNIEIEGALIRKAGFSPESALTSTEREIADRIAGQFASAGLAPPDPAQVIGQDRRRKALYRFLVESGTLVETADSGSGRIVVFHTDAIRQAICALTEKLVRGQGYAVSELNSVLGTSRKFGIPLLEYLDSQAITRRVGDLRFLAGKVSNSPS